MRNSLILAASAIVMASQSTAQQSSPDPQLRTPAVGELAPDFTVRPVTRFGALSAPFRLSDFRGETVVLWFFVKARTRG